MDRRQQLSEALERYGAAGGAEREFRTRMLELLRSPGDPFARARFDPGHFTASAFVLTDGSPRLLLIHHRRLGRWLQPGGHVEASDPDLLAAARREVGEEAGLGDLVPLSPDPFDLDIHTIPARADQPEHLHLDVRFLFRSGGETPVPSSDAAAARWVPLDRVGPLIGEADSGRVLAKLRAWSAPPAASAR